MEETSKKTEEELVELIEKKFDLTPDRHHKLS